MSRNGSKTGVAVGKFNPPHLGHAYLIERAASQVEHLYVLLCERPDQTLSGVDRQRWLVDASPSNVTVFLTPDDLPLENEPWAARALELLPVAPDIAFTSEEWGSKWAALMGARHELVDLDRAEVPISATQIRGDLGSNFHWLVPAARAALSRRVVLVGAESTGKSTLAEALARELGTVWVPEHGRWYWEGRRHQPDQTWTADEFRRIARAQRQLEDDLARRSMNGIVIADTDALVTAVWNERYLGRPDPEIDALLPSIVPDLYLICTPDFPWVQDGTRESEDHRQAMHESILRRAERSGAQVALVTGGPEARLRQGLEIIEPFRHFPALI